jgi:chemotaxis protein CheD
MSAMLPDAMTAQAGPGPRLVRIGPGEFHVDLAADAAVVTVLGSCVAVAIHDPIARIGGLNHFMLPESHDGLWGKAEGSLRYGNFAIERLVNEVLARGGNRRRLQAKLFGGASLRTTGETVGMRNARFAEQYLRDEGMPPIARSVGGHAARRVVYIPATGRAFVRSLPEASAEVATTEATFRKHLSRAPLAGDIELFD